MQQTKSMLPVTYGSQRELLKQGVALTNDYSYMTNYSFTGLNEIKPKMIEIATKNAKEAAKKLQRIPVQNSEKSEGQIRRVFYHG